MASTSSPERVRARVGATFAIELPARPTAGYAWNAEFAAARLALVSRAFRAVGPAPGAPGVERFEFSALARGEATIRFTSGRSWEGAPAEERIISVDVE